MKSSTWIMKMSFQLTILFLNRIMLKIKARAIDNIYKESVKVSWAVDIVSSWNYKSFPAEIIHL